VRLAERTAALLADGRVDLRLLTPFVREAGVTLAGTLAPRLAVSGPLDDPRIDGGLQLADGELRLRDPDVIVTGLQASATLSPGRAVITALTGTINGGTLTGTGDVDYARLEEANATLTTAIRGMGLEFPEGLRSEIEADLTLALAQSAEGPRGNLDGTVTIVRSGYREPLGVVTGLISAMRAQRLAPLVVTPEEPGLAQRLDLNIRVVTDEDLIVDNNVARLELGADLRVIGTAASPSVAGRATLREGGEIFLGRSRYTIEPGGTIDFADPETITPDLSVQARTRAGGVEIELSLQGTPDDLEPILSSPTDPLLSQADLASLLITGRRLTEVSGREAEIVGEQVISYLSGDVLGAASRSATRSRSPSPRACATATRRPGSSTTPRCGR
jgi:translocation and assembly module TamB